MAERGDCTVVVESEVSVGMSLVFNAASRFEGILNIHKDLKSPGISSKTSNKLSLDKGLGNRRADSWAC